MEKQTGNSGKVYVNRGSYDNPVWAELDAVPFGECPICKKPVNQDNYDRMDNIIMAYTYSCHYCKMYTLEYDTGNSIESYAWREWMFHYTDTQTTEGWASVRMKRHEIAEFMRNYRDLLVYKYKNDLPWFVFADYLEEQATNDYHREQIALLRQWLANTGQG